MAIVQGSVVATSAQPSVATATVVPRNGNQAKEDNPNQEGNETQLQPPPVVQATVVQGTVVGQPVGGPVISPIIAVDAQGVGVYRPDMVCIGGRRIPRTAFIQLLVPVVVACIIFIWGVTRCIGVAGDDKSTDTFMTSTAFRCGMPIILALATGGFVVTRAWRMRQAGII
mmetsp:Transcript_947/g.1619  ORF Transcript_947/g.1619 Transcript_947/m.1619 type:complete len:170 (-) Transcript_947:15-524(-)